MKSFKQYLQLVQEEKVGEVDLTGGVYNISVKVKVGNETKVIETTASVTDTVAQLSAKLSTLFKQKLEKPFTILIKKGYSSTTTLQEIFDKQNPEFEVELSEKTDKYVGSLIVPIKK